MCCIHSFYCLTAFLSCYNCSTLHVVFHTSWRNWRKLTLSFFFFFPLTHSIYWYAPKLCIFGDPCFPSRAIFRKSVIVWFEKLSTVIKQDDAPLNGASFGHFFSIKWLHFGCISRYLQKRNSEFKNYWKKCSCSILQSKRNNVAQRLIYKLFHYKRDKLQQVILIESYFWIHMHQFIMEQDDSNFQPVQSGPWFRASMMNCNLFSDHVAIKACNFRWFLVLKLV